MKYIIDVPDSFVDITNGLHIPMDKQGAFGIDTGLKLTPYTEPDEDEIRQKAHREAWELFGVIADMNFDDYEHCFGNDCEDGEFYKLSYQQAKAKYDAWKKSKSEVHLYDEIVSSVTNVKATIINISSWGQWNCINVDGAFNIDADQQILWEKTGRSFPEFGKLLKKMEVCEEDE